MATPHHWQFTRSGGFDQVRLESAQDFAELENLDQKLWTALACPVKGIEFDERTLALIDTDNDGRVRAPEVIAAVQWCEDRLKDLAVLSNGSDSLPLAQISDQTPGGKAILASAREVLKDLGKSDASAIELADVTDTARIFAQTWSNGDGIVPPGAATDDATNKVIEDVMTCMGAEMDRSGKPGLNQAKLDAFFQQAQAVDEWTAKFESDATLCPLGEATAAAYGAFKAVRAKVDDYFARCRMAAYDERSLAAVNRQQEEYLAIAAKDLSITVWEIAAFPLSKIEPSKPLPLTEGLNPAWEAGITALRAVVITPIFGEDKVVLTSEEWAVLGAKFAGYEAWLAAKPAAAVEKLGLSRLREILKSGARGAISNLIAQDLAVAEEVRTIGDVEKLVRYYRDLNRLLNNFVSFSDFYSRDRKAVFQVGTLYLDGRACNLCVHVADAGKHAALAGMSKAYLAYCDCTRPSGEKMTIAAAFTGGDSDYLMVGRNGVFYDRRGRDWDATITKVVENPLSVRQAFWAPYKKFVRMIEEYAAKRAAAKDAESGDKLAAAATTFVSADKTKPPIEPKKIDVGTVAALGVAFGAIGGLAVALVGGLMGLVSLPFWKVCLAGVGIMLLISGPSMIIAWLKLRQRNLGPILDANGWAVNGRVKMNVRFGGSLTKVAALPPGSLRSGVDPFGERRRMWPALVKFLVIVCFIVSLLNYFALIYTALDAMGVKNIPAFVTSPEDVKARGRKAVEPAPAADKKPGELAPADEKK